MNSGTRNILFSIVGIFLLIKFVKNMKFDTSYLANFVKTWEGLKLKAYQDIAGIWTIGYGMTFYPNGKSVKAGDSITQQQADEMFQQTLQKFAQGVEDSITTKVSNNQFAALVSFAYNIGLNAFKKSTLLKLVNENPNNPEIRQQFMRWVYSGGNRVQGLVNRREKEANLYFQS